MTKQEMSRRKKSADYRRRRRKVERRLRRGDSVQEIAATLRVPEDVVRRDVAALRAAAARRRPWAEPEAVAAGFIEDAEAVLQKVRKAQPGVKPGSTAYVNLVKLEWTMVVRFIEMARSAPATPADAASLDADDDDWSKSSDAELIEKAKEYGIETAGFERALAAVAAAEAPEEAPDAAA